MSSLNTLTELRRRSKGKSWSRLIAIAWERVVNRVGVCVTTSYYRVKYRRVNFGSHVTIKGKLIITGPGGVTIGAGCAFDTAGGSPNKISTVHPSARVVIGDHCFFNSVEIACRVGVEIGRRNMIGSCLIMDTDFHSVQIDRWNPEAVVLSRPIQTGDNVWVANQTLILKGVRVGANSVIGAGTVVRQSVPPNVVVIGNPQQVVKNLDTGIRPFDSSREVEEGSLGMSDESTGKNR